MSSGRVLILSSPSGAGKTSLSRAFLERHPEAVLSVSHTTRPPRPGEQDGVDYYFVDPPTFEAMVERDEFLEHATVFGNRYGTSREEVETLLEAGRTVLLDVDWQGARAIREHLSGALSVFILPPSRAALAQRLAGRAQDSPEVIARRMAGAVNEMRHHGEFQYLIVNDVFAEALADLEAIAGGEPQRRRPVTVDISALLASA
ncbi:MAG: guanylate kinase [Gammaproteobacteria bacterium]|nr:guanylate kinase [Gammaproteobacteria bacterium]